MELLPEGQKNTSKEVTWEDQQKINKFSSLINKKDEYTADLEKLKVEKEYLDDLSLEIELLDENDKINYKIGEAFVLLKATKALQRIERENEILTDKISHLDTLVDEIDEKLTDYKAQLYAKFGNNINLER